MGFIVEAGADTRVSVHQNLMAMCHQFPGTIRRQGNPVLTIFDFFGNSDAPRLSCPFNVHWLRKRHLGQIAINNETPRENGSLLILSRRWFKPATCS
jgi:hypothetical protein